MIIKNKFPKYPLLLIFNVLIVFLHLKCITVSKENLITESTSNFRVSHSCVDRAEKHSEFVTCLHDFNQEIFNYRKNIINASLSNSQEPPNKNYFDGKYLLNVAIQLQNSDPKKAYGLCIYIFNKTKDKKEKEKARDIAANALASMAEKNFEEELKKLKGELK